MASEDEPQSLRALLHEAETARASLESAPDARSPSYASAVETTLALYSRLHDQIRSVALFSPNEGIEDASTSSLPYLLIDKHIAEVVQRTPFTDASARKPVLRRARAAYERFIGLTDAYGLVKGSYAKMLERYRDDEGRFSMTAGGSDPRAAKIAAFKAEKELKQRVETMKRNPDYLGDDDLVRQVYLADVAYAIHTTFVALESLNREEEMLAMAPDAGAEHPRPGAGDDHDPTLRLDQPFRPSAKGGPLLSRQGKPLQPFTLVGSRNELAAGVFRSGHNLPTMSIDEYLAEEKRRGNILEGGTDPPKPALDEDDMDAVDRDTYKAREWDDYKDENRRGAGNSLNMG